MENADNSPQNPHLPEQSEISDASVERQPAHPEMPPPPPPLEYVGKQAKRPLRKVKLPDAVSFRTVLDMDACRQVVTRATGELEIKVKEQLKNAVPEPPKPIIAIEQYRMATPCSSRWKETPDGTRLQACSQCQLYIYDFAKLDMSEVEELVLKREGTAPKNYYRRQDGKFLTQDCPIGVAQKQKNIVLIALAALFVVGAIGLALTLPQPKPSLTASPSPDGDHSNSSSPIPLLTEKSTKSGGKRIITRAQPSSRTMIIDSVQQRSGLNTLESPSGQSESAAPASVSPYQQQNYSASYPASQTTQALPAASVQQESQLAAPQSVQAPASNTSLSVPAVNTVEQAETAASSVDGEKPTGVQSVPYVKNYR
jgi:hypothetical protein